MQCIKSIVVAALLCASATCATAQTTNKVAINHTDPKEILDINGTVRVRDLPQNGATNSIYNGSNTKTTTYNSTNLVVTDANGVLGRGPAYSSNWFYMPPMNLPIDASDARHSGGVFTVDLYTEYSRQFTTPGATTPGATSLVKYPANQLDYYVLYYDPDAFTGVSISDAGVLKYSLKPNAVITPETYFTVVYRIR